MNVELILLTLVLSCIEVVKCELVYEWNNIAIPLQSERTWRPTSFAVTKDKLFLTLLDFNKKSTGNGLVGYFNRSKFMVERNC